MVGQPKPDGSRCASYLFTRFNTGTVCSGDGATNVTFRRTAAQVIYLSRAWFERVDENGNTVIMSPFEDRNTSTTNCTATSCQTISEHVRGLAGTDSSD